MNYEKNPGDIYTNLGMVRGYASLGNRSEALKFADKAMLLVTDQNSKAYIDKMKQLVKDGMDITNY